MEWQQLLTNTFIRISQVLETSLRGLTSDDLNAHPRPDCNSIGWLAWHLTRVQDRAISGFIGEEQLWLREGWHVRFNRPHDAQDFGLGHNPEDLVLFKSPDTQTLLDYHHAVLEQTKSYLKNLTESDLVQKIDHPKFPTIGARLVAIISDNFQHAGQIAYLHGFLKGQSWLEDIDKKQ